MDLDDAIQLLRDPRLGKRGMILAAKLAARELGPVVFADGGEIWDTEKMTTDEEVDCLRSVPPCHGSAEETRRMTPIFFDPHVCSPPPTADLIGREMDFECRCGRRWRLEHYFGKDGSLLGPSWILL